MTFVDFANFSPENNQVILSTLYDNLSSYTINIW